MGYAFPLGLRGHQTITARDLVWMTVLGCTARAPVTLAEIRATFDRLTSRQWMPVGELIEDAVAEMVRGGNLEALEETDQPAFVITPMGGQIVTFLLCLPVPHPTAPLGPVALRLKLAFIDLLPPADRRREIQAFIALHEDELAARRGQCETCPVRGSFGQLWFNHDLDRLRRDLALLRTMAGLATDSSPALH